jgi:CheY-like chemotaxis protein
VGGALCADRLTILDARQTLERFMLSGELDASRFDDVVGGALRRAPRPRSASQVRAYGEMVDLLCADGRSAAAGHLEELWNGLGHAPSFTLLCAYRIDHFLHAADRGAYERVCAAHSAVLPADAFTRREGNGRNETVPRARLDGVRVLVVDDQEDARGLLEVEFQASGAAVRTAASAEEGRRALDTFQPDVIVSDIGMPDEDGLSFLRSVRARGAADPRGQTPAIAVSAYTQGADRLRAFAAGFNFYLSKPVDAAELLGVVRSLVSFASR